MDSGEVQGCLEHQTCLEVTQLIHDAAAIGACRPPPPHFLDRLLAICKNDPPLRDWVLRNCDQTDLDCAILVLGSDLPGNILRFQNPPLPTPDDLAGNGIYQAAHLVVRLQARTRNEDHALQVRQTEVLYNFAYGLSHELNNPLANISTRAGILANGERDAERRALLESIITNAMRGSEMLGDLMLIARPPELELEPVDISVVLHELAAQAGQWATPYGIVVHLETFLGAASSTALCDLDPSAFREAVWCLMRNALEAIESDGSITIRAALAAEDALSIEILDTGPGLSPTALRCCFDPFFCGRESGRGLGVGLTKAKRIVQLHEGELSLENLPTGGCLARIALPRRQQSDSTC